MRLAHLTSFALALALGAIGIAAIYLATPEDVVEQEQAPGNYVVASRLDACELRAVHPVAERRVTVPGGQCAPTHPHLGLLGGFTVTTPSCGLLAFTPAPSLAGFVCAGCAGVPPGCALRRMSGSRDTWQLVQ